MHFVQFDVYLSEVKSSCRETTRLESAILFATSLFAQTLHHRPPRARQSQSESQKPTLSLSSIGGSFSGLTPLVVFAVIVAGLRDAIFLLQETEQDHLRIDAEQRTGARD